MPGWFIDDPSGITRDLLVVMHDLCAVMHDRLEVIRLPGYYDS